MGCLEQAKMILSVTGAATLQWEAWHAEVAHYLPMIKQVIDQTQRRVLQGESVPAGEKIFSLLRPTPISLSRVTGTSSTDTSSTSVRAKAD